MVGKTRALNRTARSGRLQLPDFSDQAQLGVRYGYSWGQCSAHLSGLITCNPAAPAFNYCLTVLGLGGDTYHSSRL